MANPNGPMQPVEPSYSTWHNPTNDTVTVDVYVGPHRGGNGRERIRWEPNERKTISAEWDTAIHQVHNGTIVGGLAPQLRRLGEVNKLHPSLDPNEQARITAKARAEVARVAKRSAEDALIVATAHEKAAEEAQDAKALADARAARRDADAAKADAEASEAAAHKDISELPDDRPLPAGPPQNQVSSSFPAGGPATTTQGQNRRNR